MVVEPPKVMDAKGNTVSSFLTEEGDTVTVTISPGGATFPVTAQTNIAAPSNEASAAKASKVRYGLSDPKATSFEKSEEVAGKEEAHFDKHVKEGMHVGIARDVVSYQTKPKELTKWLEAVKADGLQPYITLGTAACKYGHPCKTPKIGPYAAGVESLIGGLMKLHKEHESTIPPVTLWGAWNEPDLNNKIEYNPLYESPRTAALFWQKARSILRKEGCSCTMVAGEFAEDDGYVGKYAAVIQHNHSFGSAYPHVWGFHDYHDLETYYEGEHVYDYPYYNSYAYAILKKLGRRLHNPRIWFSEQGVILRNGAKPTKLADSSEGEDLLRQLDAAKDFKKLSSLHLSKEQSRVELVNYYLYKGPSQKEENEKHEPYEFDSALLPGEGIEEDKHPGENPRPAYCVLALGLEGCPAKSETQAAVGGSVTKEAATVSSIINPQGLATKYLVEYGTTEAYGKTTTAAAVPNVNGMQNVTAALSGLTPCTTYHYQVEAENKANEEEKKPGFGGDKTLRPDVSRRPSAWVVGLLVP